MANLQAKDWGEGRGDRMGRQGYKSVEWKCILTEKAMHLTLTTLEK